MRLSVMAAGAAILLALGGPAADAGTCVTDYAINFGIGGANVSGDVCTDGATGVLSASNIVSWSLALSNSQNPLVTNFSISSSTGGSVAFYISGTTSQLSATSTQLTWNYVDPGLGNYAGLSFNGASNYIAFYDDHAGPSDILSPAYGTTQSITYGQGASGPFAIGRTVPEPASMALLGAGLFGIATVRRRKSA